jgi:uncharacterized protein (TIGR02246 family)
MRRDDMGRRMVSDIARVYKLWAEYAAACHAGDLDRFMALWTDDAIQMPPDAPRRIGKAAIREGMQAGFDRFHMRNVIPRTEEVRVLGDRAYSHGTYTVDMTPKGGGETMTLAAKFLDVLERQPDGSWKIAVDCHNYDMPYG